MRHRHTLAPQALLAPLAPLTRQRTVEFKVWYNSPHGGSLLEIATSDQALTKIRQRLTARGVRPRITRYYRTA